MTVMHRLALWCICLGIISAQGIGMVSHQLIDLGGDVLRKPNLLGDLNGDGFPELIVGTEAGRVHFVSIRGDDRYTVQTFNQTDLRPDELDKKFFSFSTAAIGDLDQDGYPEVVVSSLTESKLWILFLQQPEPGQVVNINTARTKVINGSDIGTFLGLRMTPVGDLDGDGVPDLLVSSFSSTHVLRFNADGTLMSHSQVINNNKQVGLLGDVDGDGRVELLLSDQRNNISVLSIDESFAAASNVTMDNTTTMANGTIAFPGPNQFVYPEGVGDFNGDGLPDMMVPIYRTPISDISSPVVYLVSLQADRSILSSELLDTSIITNVSLKTFPTDYAFLGAAYLDDRVVFAAIDAENGLSLESYRVQTKPAGSTCFNNAECVGQACRLPPSRSERVVPVHTGTCLDVSIALTSTAATPGTRVIGPALWRSNADSNADFEMNFAFRITTAKGVGTACRDHIASRSFNASVPEFALCVQRDQGVRLTVGKTDGTPTVLTVSGAVTPGRVVEVKVSTRGSMLILAVGAYAKIASITKLVEATLAPVQLGRLEQSLGFEGVIFVASINGVDLLEKARSDPCTNNDCKFFGACVSEAATAEGYTCPCPDGSEDDGEGGCRGTCGPGLEGDGRVELGGSGCVEIDMCAGDPNPCQLLQANASCLDLAAPSLGYSCGGICPDGTLFNWSRGDGDHCQNFDKCDIQKCFENVTCTDNPPESPDPWGATCGDCPPGFTGDGIKCDDTDGCMGNNCYNKTSCADTVAPETGFTCGACPRGFIGDGVTCLAFSGCDDNPCPLGKSCSQYQSFDAFSCGVCPVGFIDRGQGCELFDPCGGFPCFVSADRLYSSTCTKNGSSAGFTCGDCPAGFEGTGLKNGCWNYMACTGDPCAAYAVLPTGAATCTDRPPPSLGFDCTNICGPGELFNWTNAIGSPCDDFDGCDIQKCFENVTCTDDPPGSWGATCGDCPPGYEGTGKKNNCRDINGCIDNNCFNSSCVDNEAPALGFTCAACPSGYQGDGVVCTDIDACIKSPCWEGVKCNDKEPPSEGAECGECPAGRTGDGVVCTIEDACAASPCFENVACSNMPLTATGFECGNCPGNYTGSGSDEGGKCTKLDLCKDKPCTNSSEFCTLTDTSFACKACPVDRPEADEAGLQCVSQCTTDECGSEATCLPQPGGYICMCLDGSKVDRGKACPPKASAPITTSVAMLKLTYAAALTGAQVTSLEALVCSSYQVLVPSIPLGDLECVATNQTTVYDVDVRTTTAFATAVKATPVDPKVFATAANNTIADAAATSSSSLVAPSSSEGVEVDIVLPDAAPTGAGEVDELGSLDNTPAAATSTAVIIVIVVLCLIIVAVVLYAVVWWLNKRRKAKFLERMKNQTELVGYEVEES